MLRRILFSIGLTFVMCGVVDAGQVAVDAGRGNVTVHVPDGYVPEAPAPLLLLLHGFGVTGAEQEAQMGFLGQLNRLDFLFAHPDGTLNDNGTRFWNGTNACCDFGFSGVDDSSYLRGLIEAIEAAFNVDPNRIYIVGFSNGGFMAYRMACDHADKIAAVFSVAGMTYANAAQCTPGSNVSVVHVHGTSDGTAPYTGGNFGLGAFPGAVATAEMWATYGQCGIATFDESLPTVDVDSSIQGRETSVRRYASGCGFNGGAELWTIANGTHNFPYAAGFARTVLTWILAQTRHVVDFPNKTTLQWTPTASAQSYNVYSGALAGLTAGTLAAACRNGDDPDPTDRSFTDATVPAQGQGIYYLLGYVDRDGAESGLGRTVATPCN